MSLHSAPSWGKTCVKILPGNDLILRPDLRHGNLGFADVEVSRSQDKGHLDSSDDLPDKSVAKDIDQLGSRCAEHGC